MKYFIISDPHGHYTEMIAALNEAGFDENNPDHYLVIAGDLFDRGTENIKVLNYVHALLIKEKVTLIKGNHDEFFFLPQDLRWNMENNGFDVTLAEFSEGELIAAPPYEILQRILSKQPKLREVLSSMFDSFKIDNYVITHAGLDFNGIPNNWNSTERWINSGINDDDGNIYIFGHRNAYQLYKKVLKIDDTVHIFNYKNYIGIDGAVALFKKMFVYIIETKGDDTNE